MDADSRKRKADAVHEYRRFVQAELDARGWKPGTLARKAGMHRQTVAKIVKDDRAHLGQMPDESTMESIATGFGIPTELVRIAAARSLVNYTDDGAPISTDLTSLPLDVLFEEIRRRVQLRNGSKVNDVDFTIDEVTPSVANAGIDGQDGQALV